MSQLVGEMQTGAPGTSRYPLASARRALFRTSLCGAMLALAAPAFAQKVLQNRPGHLFSDLMVHHVGAGLADDIVQGTAGPDEFRTQPLWGAGHRMFFLHDGRTSDLMAAITAHASPPTLSYPASEANTVAGNFMRLPIAAQQAVLDFLRSL